MVHMGKILLNHMIWHTYLGLTGIILYQKFGNLIVINNTYTLSKYMDGLYGKNPTKNR